MSLAILRPMAQAHHRRRLVPKSALVAASVIVFLAVAAVAASVTVARSRLVAVPNMAGMSAEEAEEALATVGLRYTVGGTQVSARVREGRVISQDVPGGTLVKPNSQVKVVLSVGPQRFILLDLVGAPIEEARSALVALGLDVVVEAVASETTAAVVLEMFPAPGASVSPGDRVRLSVPGGSTAADVLLPYDLSGTTVLIDPAPMPAGVAVDATMEVARRLQSLLEAAGATVTTTRSAATPQTVESRVASSEASAADILVGIDVGDGGTAGISVRYQPEAGATGNVVLSAELARSVTRAATLPELTVGQPSEAADPVMAAFGGGSIRVTIGDAQSATDVAQFSDPAWFDQVARAVYRGLGSVLKGL
ncbi:MAG: PASTA domain-containing protein [Actinobacteria bacterium]|nr:PASTA domain-containing protein [Actinomycetota bacterium]